jgi:formamidopyrimidine-DNA glycosylase
MPELPDVEVFRMYVDTTALHKKIRRVKLTDTGLLAGSSSAELKRRLKGAAFQATRRHGKHLGVHLDTDAWLMLHFGMTGQLDYAKINDDPPQHTRMALHFDNDYRLAYINQRKLGRIRLADDFDAFIAEQELGPDALQIERKPFLELLSDGRGTLKARLMNQNLIAGLGNVYTDEILFQAGIDPGTSMADVTPDVAADLWRTMRRVLRNAIDRHADPEEFPDSWLTPHRGEEKCPRCAGSLKQAKISGRTSQYCPACQSSPTS